MKLNTCIFVTSTFMVASAEGEPLHFPHVYPRQYYAPPPPYSAPVLSSTFDGFPPLPSSFSETGVPSLTAPLSTALTVPATSGLWNTTSIRSTETVTSRIVITITVPEPTFSVPVVTSTKSIATTSCRLTDEGVIWCTNLSRSSSVTTTTFGTFTDATLTSFPVDTPTPSSAIGPPLSTGLSLSTGVSLSTGPYSSYTPSATPPYGNGTSFTYRWGTGTSYVPTPSSTLTSPSNATTSGYYNAPPLISASIPSWNQTSSVPTDTLTAPTDTTLTETVTASESTRSFSWSSTFSVPSYFYSWSVSTPSASASSTASSSYLTTPTPSSTIYYPSITSVPDIPSSITFEFPSKTPTASLSSRKSRTYSRSRSSSAWSYSSSSSSSYSYSYSYTPSSQPSVTRTWSFPPWPPVFTPTSRNSSCSYTPSSSLYTPSSSSTLYSLSPSSSSDAPSLSSYTPSFTSASYTSFLYSPSSSSYTPSASSYTPSSTPSLPTTTSTLSDSIPTSFGPSYYSPPPSPTGTYTDATHFSSDVSTPTPSTLSTLVSSPSETETGGYYGPPVSVPTGGLSGRVLERRERGPGGGAPHMLTDDGVAKMNNAGVDGEGVEKARRGSLM